MSGKFYINDYRLPENTIPAGAVFGRFTPDKRFKVQGFCARAKSLCAGAKMVKIHVILIIHLSLFVGKEIREEKQIQ
jgi:hypothetical protein